MFSDWSYGLNTYVSNLNTPQYLKPIRLYPGSNFRIQQENFSFEANTTYTFSVYAKRFNATASTFSFFVNLTDEDNYPIDITNNSETKTITSSTEWSRHEYTFTTGDSDSIGSIGINNPTHYSYFWGAQLERNPVASHLVITGENAVTDLPPYILMLDPSDAQGLVPNEIATYSLVHTITQDDIDAGNYLSNSVTVSATYTTPSNISGSVQDLSLIHI